MAYTFTDTQAVNAAILNGQVMAPIAALQAGSVKVTTGTVTIAAGNSQNTANVSFPAGLSGPPTVLLVTVNDGSRSVSANPGTATATYVPVHVFTTAGNSVGSSAVAFSVTVVYIGV